MPRYRLRITRWRTDAAPGQGFVMTPWEANEWFPLLRVEIRRVVRTGEPLVLHEGAITTRIERLD